jgi:hypothetical protein
MLSMSGRVSTGAANRRNQSVAVAALIGLLLIFVALPLCSAATTCSMPCCEHSSMPMDGDDATPSPGCGTECSIGAVPPASVAVLVSPEPAFALAIEVPQVLSFVVSSPPAYTATRIARPKPRPIYVINDAFLI